MKMLDNLEKIAELVAEVESCCLEIQQVLLPKLPESETKEDVNREVTAIDHCMTHITDILSEVTENE